MSGSSAPRHGGEADPGRCDVAGCANPPVRSIARVEARKAFPQMSDAGRRASLCREHYKLYKKATRKAHELDRLDW